MTAFRDPDRSVLDVFAKHLAIAETLRETELDLSGHKNEDKRRAAWAAWSNMWTQLGEARAVAVRFGRDVTAYDAAHARRNQYDIDPLYGEVLSRAAREAAEDAIDALRAAFPEVVVPGPPRAPRAPRPAQQPWPYKVYVTAPRQPDPNGTKIEKYQVSLGSPGFGEDRWFPARYESVPIGRFGNRCVCCNAETQVMFDYTPATPPRTSFRSIRVPRCRDCTDHVADGTHSETLVLLLMMASMICVALAFVRHPLFAAVPVAVVVGFIALEIRDRRRHKRLHRRGHFSRFFVSVSPKKFSVTTSNPTLYREFIELNAPRITA